MIVSNLRRILQICLISAGLCSASSVFGQIGNGLGTGKFGTFNTYSAYSLESGFLSAFNQGRVFASTGFSGNTSVNLFDASNNFTFAYGFANHLDALLSVGTYQDLNIRSIHTGAKSKTPGDIYLILRNGSYEFLDGKINLGGALSVRLPTGGQNNIPFEVYRSTKVEFGVLTMMTLFGNPYYKDQGFILNFNLGLWNHNDKGSKITPKNSFISPGATTSINAMHIQYGIGASVPVSKLQLTLDVYGLAYIKAPDTSAFSRESFMYVSPGIRYNVRSWINIGAYLDFLVAGKTNTTRYNQSTGVTEPGNPNGTQKSPNYSTWRLGLSLGFNILPVNFSSAPTEQRRKKLLDKLLEEERGAQRATVQLEKLRKVRVESEKELEKIKDELESGNQ